MPKFTFTGPDGRKYTVNGPDGSTPEQAFAVLQKQVTATKPETFDPTEGMSTTDKVLAGIGKGFVDTGRGIGQLFGLVSDKDVAEARKLDAPLMNTTAGKVGNVAGNIAAAVPTMFIPGAATLRGAAAIGAGQGLVQPALGAEERLTNIGLGGAAGAGGVAAGRAISGLWQGGKALVEPFTQAGREKIAGRVIQRFADNPAAVASARGGQTVTGATPTVAESTGDRGMAQLQDALRSLDPQIENRIGQRLSENNAARVAALESLAGDSAKRAAAETTRDATTKPLYRAATAQEIEVSPALQKLLERPSVQKALGRAGQLAKEDGRTFGLGSGTPGTAGESFVDANGNALFTMGTPGTPAKVTGETLQDIKMGMDALLKDKTSGIAGAEANAVKATRNALVQEMERSIPAFQQARTGYAALSKPINGMDVGEHIANKARANLSDISGDPRMKANALLGLLRDEPKLIQQATGRNELKSLEQVFDPDQLNLLRTVAGETDRAAAVASAGPGPGAATAKRLSSQNFLHQLIGPTGLPTSWAESVIANTAIGKPLNLVYGGVAEPKIQQVLADAVLDPAVAQAVVRAAQSGIRLPQNMLTAFLAHSARVTPATLAVTRERQQ